MLCVPDVALFPVHEPDAVQLVAFVVLQVNCDALPDATLVGEAANLNVGAFAEVTLTVALVTAPPPGPLQLNVNVVFAESALL